MNLRSVKSLEDLAKNAPSLIAEWSSSHEKFRTKAKAEGRAEERRAALLQLAGPKLDEEALARCRAALERRDLPELPELAEVLGIPTGPDMALQLEILLLVGESRVDAERMDAWDQVWAEKRTEGRAEERRAALLQLAGLYLDEEALARCRAALERRDLPELPELAEALGILTRSDVSQRWENLLVGEDDPNSGNGGL